MKNYLKHKEIFRLDVSVNDVFAVHEIQAIEDLFDDVSSFRLWNLFLVGRESSIIEILHDQIDFSGIIEDSVKGNQMLMRKEWLYLYFSEYMLL